MTRRKTRPPVASESPAGLSREQHGSGKAWVVRPELATDLDRTVSQERLDEAINLAQSIELDVRGSELFPLRSPRPGTLIGEGRLAGLQETVKDGDIEVVVVDAGLTPVQQRNLERRLACKVIDRTGLILEIFGERARTKEGALQVELAALTYQRSRLVRSWTHLERQRGGLGFIGGPGESQIEIDRRRIDERITRLKKQLEDVRRTRRLQRTSRERVPLPAVALVGYTNAGKSTWFNRLSHAEVMVKDQLFATLDPTIRAVKLPNQMRVVLSDTVGFISDLPTQLVAAFRATLEEVLVAELIVHVRDISSPSSENQTEDVVSVLDALGVDEASRDARLIELWNKADRVDAAAHDQLAAAAARREDVVLGSAATGEGEEALLDLIGRRLAADRRHFELELPAEAGETLALLHRLGDVLEQRSEDSSVRVIIRVETAQEERLQQLAETEGLRLRPAYRA